MPRSLLFLLGVLLLAIGVHLLLQVFRGGSLGWQWAVAAAVGGIILLSTVLFSSTTVVGRVSSATQAAMVSPQQIAYEHVILTASAFLQMGRLQGFGHVQLTENHLVVNGRLSARWLGTVLPTVLGPIGWAASLLLSFVGRRVDLAIPYRALPPLEELVDAQGSGSVITLHLPPPPGQATPLMVSLRGTQALQFQATLQEVWRGARL